MAEAPATGSVVSVRLTRPAGPDPWFARRPAAAVAVSAVLYAVVLALRFAVDYAGDSVSLLYVLPIALLAVTFGLRAGLAAGVLGILLVVVWVLVENVQLTAWGWLTRAVPMLLLGVLVGDAMDRLRASERERRRLAALAQRHRDAVEIQDSVVQHLAAAKWALETGRSDRGLEILTGTLDSTQRLVSDLLGDADRR